MDNVSRGWRKKSGFKREGMCMCLKMMHRKLPGKNTL